MPLLVRRHQVGELAEYTLRGVALYEGVARAGQDPTADTCGGGGGCDYIDTIRH